MGEYVERVKIEARFEHLIEEHLELGKLVSYFANKRIPFLRLYRYKEAFSLEFVQRFLDYFDAKPCDLVLDPFAGIGTALFGAMVRGISSIGVERLPIAAFVAQTLPLFFRISSGQLWATYENLVRRVDACPPAPIAMDVPLMTLAFESRTLQRLRQWKTAIEELDSPLREIFRLLFFAILEATSFSSNDGQFPRITKWKKPLHPDEALCRKTQEAEADLSTARVLWEDWSKCRKATPQILLADARQLETLLTSRPSIVITSPPYVNRYDYTRSYCLELCFHFVRNFAELRNLRHSILRSHIESRLGVEERPNHPAIWEVVTNLECRSLNNPRIPHMLVAYFLDMEKVINGLGAVLAPKARVALVVDNVRFEGELIPVDLVLSELAEQHGFSVEKILVARYKGNSSQQMARFGRVPVRESVILWRKG